MGRGAGGGALGGGVDSPAALALAPDASLLIARGARGFAVHARRALLRGRSAAAPPRPRFVFEGGAVSVAECLPPTNLLAHVGAGGRDAEGVEGPSPRTLVLGDAAAAESDPEGVVAMRVGARVTAVRLTRTAVVALTPGEARVYSLETQAELARVPCACDADGLCAISDTGVLALPAADARPGAVLLYDTERLEVLGEVHAHKSRVSALAFAPDASAALLATASSKGTIVRVFDVRTAQRVASFRRGRQPAMVCALAFSPAPEAGGTRLLAATSDSGSVHVFRMDPGAGEARRAEGGVSASRIQDDGGDGPAAAAGAAAAKLRRWARGALTAAASAGVVPERLVDAVEPPAAAVIVRLPSGRVPKLCALTWPDGSFGVPEWHAQSERKAAAVRLVVMAADGNAYEYEVHVPVDSVSVKLSDTASETPPLVWHHDLVRDKARVAGSGGFVSVE